MSEHRPPLEDAFDAGYWRAFMLRMVVGIVGVFAIFAAWLIMMPDGDRARILNYWANVEIPAPSLNLAPLIAAPLSLQLHVAAAVLALIIGVVIFTFRKGTGFHRFLGWSWVGSMIIVAATSIAMIADFKNGINALHAFTAITVVSLWAGLTGIRRGNVGQHAGSMIGLYVGGLIIAGGFAFIPGRTMWNVVFGG
jgi:uncharacterized membrane protein